MEPSPSGLTIHFKTSFLISQVVVDGGFFYYVLFWLFFAHSDMFRSILVYIPEY